MDAMTEQGSRWQSKRVGQASGRAEDSAQWDGEAEPQQQQQQQQQLQQEVEQEQQGKEKEQPQPQELDMLRAAGIDVSDEARERLGLYREGIERAKERLGAYRENETRKKMAWMEVEVARHQDRLDRTQRRRRQQREQKRELGLVQEGLSPISPRQTPRPPVSPRNRDQLQQPQHQQQQEEAEAEEERMFSQSPFDPQSPRDPRFEVSTTMDGPAGDQSQPHTPYTPYTRANDHGDLTRSRMSPHELDTDQQYAEVHATDAHGTEEGGGEDEDGRSEAYAFPETPSALKFSARKRIGRPSDCFDKKSVVRATLGPTAVDMSEVGRNLRYNASAQAKKELEAEHAARKAQERALGANSIFKSPRIATHSRAQWRQFDPKTAQLRRSEPPQTGRVFGSAMPEQHRAMTNQTLLFEKRVAAMIEHG